MIKAEGVVSVDVTPLDRVLEAIKAGRDPELGRSPTFCKPDFLDKVAVDRMLERLDFFGFSYTHLTETLQFCIPKEIQVAGNPNKRPALRSFLPTGLRSTKNTVHTPSRDLFWSDPFDVLSVYSFDYVHNYTHELGHWLVSSPKGRGLLDFGLSPWHDYYKETLGSFVQLMALEQFGIKCDPFALELGFTHRGRRDIRDLNRIISSLNSKSFIGVHDAGWLYLDGIRL